jgi:undecaprenyl diphosphate synthase
MENSGVNQTETNSDNLLNDISKFPSHVAIIMDGNRRWAKKFFNSNTEFLKGHEKGCSTLKNIINFIAKLEKIDVLTVFAFSTENWNRSPEEVQGLLSLVMQGLEEEYSALSSTNIKIRVLGSRQNLSPDLCESIDKIEKETKDKMGMQLVIAFNYGGHWDITEGCNRAIKAALSKIDDQPSLESYMPSSFLPPVDLLIRTGGEQRLSNFLLWQLAYAECVFMDVLWPDFTPENFVHALRTFSSRERRFGSSVLNTTQ